MQDFYKIELKRKNLFIGDAHYSSKNTNLIELLSNLDKTKVEQIIFMGDIFDILVGNADIFISDNIKLIDAMNAIDKDIEVIFLEGNHDFNLKYVLKNIKIFSRNKQPIIMETKKANFLLSHGDNYANEMHEFYMNFVKNRFILKLLLMINKFSSGKIEDIFYNHLKNKNNCADIKNYREIAQKRVDILKDKVDFEKYNITHIIEGHFHQNKSYSIYNVEYINTPAFVCKKELLHIDIDKVEIKRGSYEYCLH